MKRSTLLLPLSAAAVLSLAACGGNSVSKTLGLASSSPDEFTVTTRAPLSVPPDLQNPALPAPTPGLARPQETPLTQQAEETLAPQLALNPAASGPDSPGQEALVAQAGPEAPANIRALVGADAVRDEQAESLTERLLFWQSKPLPGAVVDAPAEEARLQKDAALGESPTTGETPVIDRTKSKFLGIF